MTRESWQILERAGLPVARRACGSPPPSVESLASAALEAIADPSMEPRDREAVAALLLAWRHGWPRSFAAGFAASAAAAEGWATRQFEDPNRYLKLRRIALANLAYVL